MTVLLKEIRMYKNGSSTYSLLTDDEKITLKFGAGSKASTVDVTLKNAWSEHIENGEFKYDEDDIIKVYAKWATEPTDAIAETNLLISADILEINAIGDEKSSKWVMNGTDRTFLILNRLWSKAYPLTEEHTVEGIDVTGWTAPQIITKIINITSTSGKNQYSDQLYCSLAVGSIDSNGIFQRTGGGYIQPYRPTTTVADQAFPIKAISKVFKPVYEWIEDLSQPDMTNTQSELSESGTPPAPRPFIFYIDESNNCHWTYPDVTTPSVEMTWGTNTAVGSDTTAHYITSFNLKKVRGDIINHIFFNAGDDLNGSGILDHYFNPNTKNKKLKSVYRSWVDITSNAISYELFSSVNKTKYTETTNGTLLFQGKKYTANYPFTPHWSSTSVTTDTELNNSLRNWAAHNDGSEGKARAQRITNNRGQTRWKGTINIRGEKRSVGELIQFNSTQHGIKNAKVRITDITHTISNNGWDSVLNVQQDEEGITNV